MTDLTESLERLTMLITAIDDPAFAHLPIIQRGANDQVFKADLAALLSENEALRTLLVRAGKVLGPFVGLASTFVERNGHPAASDSFSIGQDGHATVGDFRAARDLKAEIEEIVKS